jgi:hypothetical protein
MIARVSRDERAERIRRRVLEVADPDHHVADLESRRGRRRCRAVERLRDLPHDDEVGVRVPVRHEQGEVQDGADQDV